MTTNIDRATKMIGANRATAPADIAQDLADAGLLATAPRIISTVPELEALDPDTMLMHRAYRALIHPVVADETDLPLSVVATGEQVRAALKALEEA